mmetsp:Transcript_8189/g.11806  ORF Transcript_8189/g.11806 Transcript_8189/m.11806 type:complete len:112 (+) Transcript_8189:3-338(+)
MHNRAYRQQAPTEYQRHSSIDGNRVSLWFLFSYREKESCPTQVSDRESTIRVIKNSLEVFLRMLHNHYSIESHRPTKRRISSASGRERENRTTEDNYITVVVGDLQRSLLE